MDYENNNDDYTFEVDHEPTYTANGGVSQVSVSVTLSTKALGADAFIKLEETWDFHTPASPGEAACQRAEIIEVLRDQAMGEAKKTVAEVRAFVASTPKGAVSVHDVNPNAAPTASQFGQAAPASGPAATVAVANGAAPASSGGLEWRSLPDRFDDTKQFRYVSTISQPSEVLVAQVNQWLVANGFNPDAFKVWDNRTGPRGLEAGVPQSCVAAVKVGKDAESYVSPDLARQQLARVKHNADGSLYIWFTKEAEAAIKYGALDQLKLGA
jgi:hypothetical protein